jgi:TonB family protein
LNPRRAPRHDDEGASFWPLLIASGVLHVIAFLMVGRMHGFGARQLDVTPIQMVQLSDKSFGKSSSPAASTPRNADVARPAPTPPQPKAPEPAKSSIKVKAPEPPAAKPAPARPTPADIPPMTASKPTAGATQLPADAAKPTKPKAEPRPATEAELQDRLASLRAKYGVKETAQNARPSASANDDKSLEKLRASMEQMRKKYGDPTPTLRLSDSPAPGGGRNVMQQMRVSNYYGELLSAVDRVWAVPPSLEHSNLLAVVSAVIDRNGNILRYTVETPSGNAVFDQAAVRTLFRASPLPPIPRDIPDDIIEVGIRFHGK